MGSEAAMAARHAVTSTAEDRGPDWSFLRGKRVLDLSRLLPGPFASSLLADLGADVVKVEDPGTGDPARTNPGRFAALNRNKRSIALDLRKDEGRRAFLELVAEADAVVESFRPGVLDRWGIGYQVLREVNPRLVLCSLSGYGQTGPDADLPGHDVNFLARSGFYAVPGAIDREVVRPGVRVGDMPGAFYAAFALVVALAGAERSGQGQQLDVSLAECTAAWCAMFALPALALADPQDDPLLMGDNAVFETSDARLLSFGVFEDKFWIRFRKVLAAEFPELDTDAFDRRGDRTAAKQRVHELLTEVFRARPLEWWESRLSDLGLPWAPVAADARRLLEDPQFAARELFHRIPGEEPEGPDPDQDGSHHQARFPVRFGLGLDTFRRPSPALDEHGEELREELREELHE
jgi:crotonobetainyl-CoA:carnitine CoA-transferase CaiB-like acyl-CoA transferase